MKMYIDGRWEESPSMLPLRSPFSGEQFESVPQATIEQVDRALRAAEKGARVMARLSGRERADILCRAADLLEHRCEDIARTITQESGKPLTEARGEASRMPDLLRLCAYEGTQQRGETLPLDSHVGATGKLGFVLRVPCGVVVAITPFNYPLLLVVHKIGPALAAGNAVILKPAHQTPQTALKLTELLLEAGLPEHGLQCITGSGKEVAAPLCSDSRPRVISFTGSAAVGRAISQIAGVKKLSLELGSNSPLIVMPDADLQQVAEATAVSGYVNAGQVCISTQRVLVDQDVYDDYLDAVKAPVEAIETGDPFKETTRLGAMICADEADRVDCWVKESLAGGARLVTGGQRSGAVYAPTVVADVDPGMRVFQDELFGPVVTVTAFKDIDHAISLANNSTYGLGAGVFTRDIMAAMRFARELEMGNVMVNWTPLWRADLQPYGGVKQSGIGAEGPRYAVQSMTEMKTVVFHGLSGAN